jgi:hypothetical protein
LSKLRRPPLQALIAGPLTGPDGSTRGSFFLYEADDIAAVRRQVAENPFSAAGIWKTVDIYHFENRANNH